MEQNILKCVYPSGTNVLQCLSPRGTKSLEDYVVAVFVCCFVLLFVCLFFVFFFHFAKTHAETVLVGQYSFPGRTRGQNETDSLT